MSLSIVLGTPMQGMPSPLQVACRAQRAVAADDHEAVQPVRSHRRPHPVHAVVELVRLDPGRAQDRAAPGQDPAAALHRQRLPVVLEHPPPRVAEPDHLAVVHPFDLAHQRHGSRR